MDELMKAAYARRKRIENGSSASGSFQPKRVSDTNQRTAHASKADPTAQATNDQSKAAPIALVDPLANPRVDCIIAAGEFSVCRINGIRLVIGQTYPATKWEVSSIEARRVTLRDGKHTRMLGLSSVKPGQVRVPRDDTTAEAVSEGQQ